MPLWWLDLDEVDVVSKQIALFSWEKCNVYSLISGDHCPQQGFLRVRWGWKCDQTSRAISLKKTVLERLKMEGLQAEENAPFKIYLLTCPRVAGYLFNPVSFYFVSSTSGEPMAALAEVTNTFGEVKYYMLNADKRIGQTFRMRVPKLFYVSPFSELDLEFDFNLKVPGQTLCLRIDDYQKGRCVFRSSLTGRAIALTNRNVVWSAIRYPIIPLQVIFGIHWQALKLWLKKVPWFPKASNPEKQCDIIKPAVAKAAK